MATTLETSTKTFIDTKSASAQAPVIVQEIQQELDLNGRTAAVCTAKSYNLRALLDYMKPLYKTSWYKDAVHVDYLQPKSMPASSTQPVKDIFFFSYGVAVFWGFNEQEEQAILQELKPFELNPLDAVERELMTFSIGQAQKIEEEEIILPDSDSLSRLAVSHGIAQSVKLSIFEAIIQKTINNTKNIPEQLATQGRIPLSKQEIRKKMGELFIERSSVNLHSDILDVPEFFWDHSEVEPLYTMIANHLDLETRIEVLNQRLDNVHDLFEMLGNELNHQHSSKLEWIIIILIGFEITITLLRDVFDLI